MISQPHNVKHTPEFSGYSRTKLVPGKQPALTESRKGLFEREVFGARI